MTTIRSLAETVGIDPLVLLQRLELDPANHDIDQPLRPRIEALWRSLLDPPK